MSDALKVGLYEKLITEALEERLSSLEDELVMRAGLRSAEAADRLALHVARVVESALAGLSDKERVKIGLQLARELTRRTATTVGRDDLLLAAPVSRKSVLSAILARNPDGSPARIETPLIPLLDTTLLTNAPGEPRVGHQIRTEIASAGRIDLVMAFIRRSGIRPFRQALTEHCEKGRPLRVLTTTYTNSTEQAALEELQRLGADVQVSYDTTGTRLHAKAWVFHRPGGMSTAYIGSSNLTHQAQHTGLEWNLRVSGARNAAVIDKMAAVFESYCASDDFKAFDAEEFAARAPAPNDAQLIHLAPLEIRLYPYQERMLERIAVARERGYRRNLLVAATGTGKTVMAAVDYARLAKQSGGARLLFVAHRKEILEQARGTFRYAVHDGGFGDLWVDGQRPTNWNHVFASIQSLAASGLDHLPADHFDIVIIDEVHHGAAQSYETLLTHIEPQQLLGLTATPERADGLDILKWFDGRIAAELRLWDAIDQQQLVPFDYYGVHDNTDLTRVSWTRGRGYHADELTRVYTADEAWAKLVINQLQERADLGHMAALGFCVDVNHAEFMAAVFCKYGIPAQAVTGGVSAAGRKAAIDSLRAGEIRVLFSVDIFNEGIDLPSVDVLLLLRPTESPVLFLQQLGRGLRKAENKVVCTVLDFVGQHRQEFRFHRKLQALIGGSRKHVQRQVEEGFPFLPTGCSLELEAKARDIILDSIRKAVPDRWPAKVAELRMLSTEGVDTLAGFLEHSGLELADLYSASDGKCCWSDLREAAGLATLKPGPAEHFLRRAIGRLLHVDDHYRLNGYRRLLQQQAAPRITNLTPVEARLARMLVAQLCDQVPREQLAKNASLQAGLDLVWQHPQLRQELIELFEYLQQSVDHLHSAVATHPDAPLQVHARYTRIEVLAALAPRDTARKQAWREGVKWLPDIQTDVMAFTLDKTKGGFSPTTRYNDYAISPGLVHWESQSRTTLASTTGQRYVNQAKKGTHVMLFARESAAERAFWFLGTADYCRHAEGKECPMAITWRLHEPLSGDLYAAFAAAVA